MNSDDNEEPLDFDSFLGNESENEDDLTFPLNNSTDNEEEDEGCIYDLNFALLTSIPFSKLNIRSLLRFENESIFRLSAEEQSVIDRCANPTLRKLLVLNRCKCMQLKQLYKQLHRIYVDCNKEIGKLQETISTPIKEGSICTRITRTDAWKLGIPYFKDKNFCGAPPNSDVQKKKGHKELWMSEYTDCRRWTLEDQANLRKAVVDVYYEYRKVELQKQISACFKNNDKIEDTKMLMKHTTLSEELIELEMQGPQEIPPLGFDYIDWAEVSCIKLKGRHEPSECKGFWNIYLHPSINKKDWTYTENKQILNLALKHCNQDWDCIAHKLNTNRSGYLVCIQFYTRLCSKFKRQRFLPEEDELLLKMVDECRIGEYIPWSKIVNSFKHRSKMQLYHRYKYYLTQPEGRKGPFSLAEDILLVHLVERLGKNYATLADYIPDRLPVQLRNRYSSYLERETLQLGSFTLEEDKRIWNYARTNGMKHWPELANQLRRARAHVRQRYITLKKYLKTGDTEKNWAQVPRRKQQFLSSYRSGRYKVMKRIVGALKTYSAIPTLDDVHTLLKTDPEARFTKKGENRRRRTGPRRRYRTKTDKQLMTFFRGTYNYQRQKKVSEPDMMDSARRIIRLMEVLGADYTMLKTADESHVLLSKLERDTLMRIKDLLNENEKEFLPKWATIVNSNVAIPGSSSESPLLLSIPFYQIEHVLPPTINTILGLRCLIIKYDLYKSESTGAEASVDAISKLTPWTIGQQLLRLDTYTRDIIKEDEKIFFRRLYSLLKWPSILSTGFPAHLTSAQKDIEGVPKSPKKPGRPRKVPNVKVQLMMEAKRKMAGTSDACGTNPEEETVEFELDSSDGSSSSYDDYGSEWEDASFDDEYEYFDDDDEEDGEGVHEFDLNLKYESFWDTDNLSSYGEHASTSQPKPAEPIKVVNLRDLKMDFSNAAVVNRNTVMKLASSGNDSKIVVLGVENSERETAPSAEGGSSSMDEDNEDLLNVPMSEFKISYEKYNFSSECEEEDEDDFVAERPAKKFKYQNGR